MRIRTVNIFVGGAELISMLVILFALCYAIAVNDYVYTNGSSELVETSCPFIGPCFKPIETIFVEIFLFSLILFLAGLGNTMDMVIRPKIQKIKEKDEKVDFKNAFLLILSSLTPLILFLSFIALIFMVPLNTGQFFILAGFLALAPIAISYLMLKHLP